MIGKASGGIMGPGNRWTKNGTILLVAASFCFLLAGWTAARGKTPGVALKGTPDEVALGGAPDKDWPVPPEAAKIKNPVAPNADNLASAHAIWMDKCANCHGEKGAGDGPEAEMYDPLPAALNDSKMVGEMTDGEIYYKITEGRKPMPSFKKQLTDEQRWQLVNFIRTLASKPAPKPGATHNERATNRAKLFALLAPYFTCANAVATSAISGTTGMSYCFTHATFPPLLIITIARPVIPLSARYTPNLSATAPRGLKSASSGYLIPIFSA
jgi:mono/diheme cytochrome c family protein